MTNHTGKRHGATLIEMLLVAALLGILGLFVMEFLTTAWLSSEKDMSRTGCLIAGENLIEKAAALAIARPGDLGSVGNNVTNAYKMILGNNYINVPSMNVATWTQISAATQALPGEHGAFLARIATDTSVVGSYTLFVGDALLGNKISIQSYYASKTCLIDFNQEL